MAARIFICTRPQKPRGDEAAFNRFLQNNCHDFVERYIFHPHNPRMLFLRTHDIAKDEIEQRLREFCKALYNKFTALEVRENAENFPAAIKQLFVDIPSRNADLSRHRFKLLPRAESATIIKLPQPIRDTARCFSGGAVILDFTLP